MTTPSSNPPPTGKRSLFGRRDSLIKQASLDREQNEGLRRQSTLRGRQELERKSLCKAILSLHCAGDSREVIQSALTKFLAIGLHLVHLETRPDLAHSGELEMRAQLGGKKWQFLEALTKLVIERAIERIELRHPVDRVAEEGERKGQNEEDGVGGAGGGPGNNALAKSEMDQQLADTTAAVWYPRHVSELDQCAHVLVKYEPTEDPKHPGFGDQGYIARREELNQFANSYRHGDAIPHVEYNEEEHNTWRVAYEHLKELRQTHTCAEYQRNIAELERVGLITSECIPQLRDLSNYLQKKTGFELRPCGGLLSARDFLASLAFRVFQTTLYVRHSSAPHHCPEPDVIHEILGHVPMFADEHLAQMSQEIGLLSLGATDEQIERLATVYWFIIEFGLCRQQGQLRAIGAGLLSAYGELKYACSDVPGHEPFEPAVTALRPYEDSDYQPIYFVAESIQQAMDRVREYAQAMCPQRSTVFNPLSRTVQCVPTRQLVERRMVQLQRECAELCKLMDRMKADENE